jgi:hypothetical protein
MPSSCRTQFDAFEAEMKEPHARGSPPARLSAQFLSTIETYRMMNKFRPYKLWRKAIAVAVLASVTFLAPALNAVAIPPNHYASPEST